MPTSVSCRRPCHADVRVMPTSVSCRRPRHADARVMPTPASCRRPRHADEGRHPRLAFLLQAKARIPGMHSFLQVMLPIAGIQMHALHVPGKGPDPMPLLLLHGWPGSVFEFLDIIPRLTDPARFGNDPADAFTVVAPSLPGYGLSFKPGQPRFAVEEIADCVAELMHDALGYPRFAVQGGDWGGITASRLGYAHPDKLIGIHLNLLSVRRDPSLLV